MLQKTARTKCMNEMEKHLVIEFRCHVLPNNNLPKPLSVPGLKMDIFEGKHYTLLVLDYA